MYHINMLRVEETMYWGKWSMRMLLSTPFSVNLKPFKNEVY